MYVFTLADHHDRPAAPGAGHRGGHHHGADTQGLRAAGQGEGGDRGGGG